MKNFIALFIMLNLNCQTKQQMTEEKFIIEVWDFNPSMSVTFHYHVSNDGLRIERVSGLQGEGSHIIVENKITDAEIKKIAEALSSLSINSLKDEYVDPLTEDGNQKTIELTFGEKRKKIRVYNVFVKDLATIIGLVNSVLESEYFIKYP